MNDKELQEYLKKQAESISVPDLLTPKKMEMELEKVEPKSSTPFFRRHYQAAAAAFLLLLTIAGLTGRHFLPDTNNQPEETTVAENKSDFSDRISYDKAYDTIHAFYEQQRDGGSDVFYFTEQNDMAVQEDVEAAENTSGMGAPVEKAAPTKDKAVGGTYTDTDVQVKGVMEGDIVKTDGSYLYSLHEEATGYGITIYSVNGEKVRKVSNISIENGSVDELYLEKNRLIVIGYLWDEVQTQPAQGERTTQIQIYDVSNPASPKKLRTQTQSGTYSSSRVVGNYLYTFSEYSVSSALDKKKPETYIPMVNDEVIPEEKVRCVSDTPQKTYMVMTSLAVNGSSNYTDTISTLGGADVYYVSNEFIYAAADASNTLGSFTKISKYRYKDGKFTYQTACQVRGTIRNSYYLHEQDGNLCFVYNKRTLSGRLTNGLCILDKNLKHLGEIGNLGNDETIYASYFMGNMAYFVTYLETDPVFAVDLSDPADPKLRSELKLPGYSDYLHSLGDNHLVGIGIDEYETEEDDYWEDCVKISIFSIDKKKQIKQTAKKRLPAYDGTLAANNRHSVLIDEEEQLIGFLADAQDEDRMDYLLFSYNEETGDFKEMLKQKNISSNTRGVRIGSYFYVVDGESGVTCYAFPTCGTPGTLEEPVSFEAK